MGGKEPSLDPGPVFDLMTTGLWVKYRLFCGTCEKEELFNRFKHALFSIYLQTKKGGFMGKRPLEDYKEGLLIWGRKVKGKRAAAEYAYWQFECFLMERRVDRRPLLDNDGVELEKNEKFELIQAAVRESAWLSKEGKLQKRILTNLRYLAARIDWTWRIGAGHHLETIAQRKYLIGLYYMYVNAFKRQDWDLYFKALGALKAHQRDPEDVPLSGFFD